MSNQDQRKRRRVPRRDFRRRVGILVNGNYHVNQSTQIGEGGMMICCDQELQKDQMLVITFRLPGFAQTVVRAAVRYILPMHQGQPRQYGVEFLNLDFSVKREIRNYVASKSTDEYERVPA